MVLKAIKAIHTIMSVDSVILDPSPSSNLPSCISEPNADIPHVPATPWGYIIDLQKNLIKIYIHYPWKLIS